MRHLCPSHNVLPEALCCNMFTVIIVVVHYVYVYNVLS